MIEKMFQKKKKRPNIIFTAVVIMTLFVTQSSCQIITASLSNDETWLPVGIPIYGEASTDWSGYAIALSSDDKASYVAIGAHKNDGTPVLSDRGQVRNFHVI